MRKLMDMKFELDKTTLISLLVVLVISIPLMIFAPKFYLALLPLIVILIGIILFRVDGMTMAFVGLILSIVLAVGYFRTPGEVAIMASVYGFIKSFGISIAVIVTMFMIFIMKEMQLLDVISEAVKKAVQGKEMTALFIGIGFGSFLTCLGVVTPAMFPPVLMAMGFSAPAAVAIAVMGYNATTSFALLSIPITLPASISPSIIDQATDHLYFAYKISLFLPVISIGFSFAILWMVGGKKSVKKGFWPGILCGLTIALSCLAFTGINVFFGKEVFPISIIGIVAGLMTMLALYLYNKVSSRGVKEETNGGEGAPKPKYTRNQILMAFSPWIILTVLAAVISIPPINSRLKSALGNYEVLHIYNKAIDLDILSQIYFWILMATLISFIILKPSKEQLGKTTKFWAKAMWKPFLAYSIYFSIAFVMAWSAMHVVNGDLQPSQDYADFNMNVQVGNTLATVFGVGFIFVAASLGLFGAIVGGSETGSNVLFKQVQVEAAQSINLTPQETMTVYSSHAVAGGVASAVTPAKINNAVATINEGSELESEIMRKHMLIVVVLTIITGIMAGIFVNLGL